MARLAPVLLLRIHITLLALALVCLAVPTAAASHAKARPSTTPPVPSTFVGVDAGGPLFNDNVNLDQQFSTMVSAGVQSIRVVFNWAAAQPYADDSKVPVDQQDDFTDIGGVPTSFVATDKIVETAVAHGLAVLPTVLYAPGWDQGTNRSGGLAPPARTRPYTNYLTALIGRYGPRGTFWSSHRPRRPIRSWQIWNEPNLPAFWPQPFASSYVGLLRAAHAAIKNADPGAQVVLGALTNTAWTYLGQIYRIHGARNLFDVIAVNGFTSTPTRVLEFLQLVRRAANRLGDPTKPLLATELSWPSAVGQHVGHRDWDTTERGQATNIAALLPLLAAYRQQLHLQGFDYYTWVTQSAHPGHDDFNFAGLLNYQDSGLITAKPALSAYRKAALALEQCRRKGPLATSCAKK
jgi:hypothetical protein